MSYKKLSEHLESGDVENINISGNIGYELATGPEFEGMTLRIGEGGKTSLHRAPDVDVHWEDTDNTAIDLTDSEQIVLTVTPTQDLLPSDSSYSIIGKISNSSIFGKEMTVRVYNNGVQIGQAVDLDIAGGEVNKLFLFSGAVETTIPAGNVLTVAFKAHSNNDIVLHGDITQTKIKITKSV